jgi:hypothetical protein
MAAGRMTGLNVHVVAYDHSGSEYGADAWNTKYGEGESLDEVLERVAALPPEEARVIAADFLAELRQKKWEQELRGEERKVIPFLIGTFGLAAVGIAALVALLIWWVVKLL